jgi:catechol 2,3-dioxygenase-like lactoylglutathione lyase family enzyme
LFLRNEARRAMSETAAPAIDGIVETALYARDLKRTTAFYRDIMGLPLLLETPRLAAFDAGRQTVLLVFQQGDTSADIVDARGTIPGHEGAGRLHFALAISAAGLDAWRIRLASAGIALTGEYRWPAGATSLYFSDPDGAVVELATPGLWATR